MTTELTLTDPLAKAPVHITITVQPASEDQPKENRAILLSLGVAGELPVQKQGSLAQLPELIDAAWLAFGVQQQAADASTDGAIQQDVEEVLADVTMKKQPAPQPQAKNLSLF